MKPDLRKFLEDTSFMPLEGYNILGAVKDRLIRLTVEYTEKNAADILYAINTLSEEDTGMRRDGAKVTQLFGMRRDGVDYCDETYGVAEIKLEDLYRYRVFFKLTAEFDSRRESEMAGWRYRLSRVKYDAQFSVD